ncbi:hypothetical protein AHAS_Ahas13G0112300 [Arachis hypogaea]
MKAALSEIPSRDSPHVVFSGNMQILAEIRHVAAAEQHAASVILFAEILRMFPRCIDQWLQIRESHVSPSKQHAGCVVTSFHHVSVMQQHAGNVLTAVSIQEASVASGTRVIYSLVWFRCIKAEVEWGLASFHFHSPLHYQHTLSSHQAIVISSNANRNLLSRKFDQPETWHSAIDQALQTIELYQLLRVEVIRENSTMLSALVER